MIRIDTLRLGSYRTNCYIVREENASSCALIDPGDEAERVLTAVETLGLTVDAILLTHGHFDHTGGVKAIVAKTGCRLWMSQSDWSQKTGLLYSHLFPLANCDFCEVSFCEDGEEIQAGGLTFTTVSTPGHTWGSVCFLCEDTMFSGDTLFAGTCGRTDLPGGSWETIRTSLARLGEMEEDYRVFPGHGESTTLSREKLYNPCMKGSL